MGVGEGIDIEIVDRIWRYTRVEQPQYYGVAEVESGVFGSGGFEAPIAERVARLIQLDAPDLVIGLPDARSDANNEIAGFRIELPLHRVDGGTNYVKNGPLAADMRDAYRMADRIEQDDWGTVSHHYRQSHSRQVGNKSIGAPKTSLSIRL